MNIACIVLSDNEVSDFWKTLEACENAEKPEAADWYALINYNKEIVELIESSSIVFEAVFVGEKTIEEHLEFVREFEEEYDKVIVIKEGETFGFKHIIELIGDEDDICGGSSTELWENQDDVEDEWCEG